jgi:hypothetical protein
MAFTENINLIQELESIAPSVTNRAVVEVHDNTLYLKQILDIEKFSAVSANDVVTKINTATSKLSGNLIDGILLDINHVLNHPGHNGLSRVGHNHDNTYVRVDSFSEYITGVDFTKANIMDFRDSDYVHTSGSESIQGLKTFSITPLASSQGIQDNSLVTYKFVKDLYAGTVYKGEVATFDLLPSTNVEVGDAYYVQDEKITYCYRKDPMNPLLRFWDPIYTPNIVEATTSAYGKVIFSEIDKDEYDTTLQAVSSSDTRLLLKTEADRLRLHYKYEDVYFNDVDYRHRSEQIRYNYDGVEISLQSRLDDFVGLVDREHNITADSISANTLIINNLLVTPEIGTLEASVNIFDGSITNINNSSTIQDINDNTVITNVNTGATVSNINTGATVTNVNAGASITDVKSGAEILAVSGTISNVNAGASITDVKSGAEILAVSGTISNVNTGATITNVNTGAIITDVKAGATINGVSGTISNVNTGATITNVNAGATITNVNSGATIEVIDATVNIIDGDVTTINGGVTSLTGNVENVSGTVTTVSGPVTNISGGVSGTITAVNTGASITAVNTGATIANVNSGAIITNVNSGANITDVKAGATISGVSGTITAVNTGASITAVNTGATITNVNTGAIITNVNSGANITDVKAGATISGVSGTITNVNTGAIITNVNSGAIITNVNSGATINDNKGLINVSSGNINCVTGTIENTKGYLTVGSFIFNQDINGNLVVYKV